MDRGNLLFIGYIFVNFYGSRYSIFMMIYRSVNAFVCLLFIYLFI